MPDWLAGSLGILFFMFVQGIFISNFRHRWKMSWRGAVLATVLLGVAELAMLAASRR